MYLANVREYNEDCKILGGTVCTKILLPYNKQHGHKESHQQQFGTKRLRLDCIFSKTKQDKETSIFDPRNKYLVSTSITVCTAKVASDQRGYASRFKNRCSLKYIGTAGKTGKDKNAICKSHYLYAA
jgi:hypothetical protein